MLLCLRDDGFEREGNCGKRGRRVRRPSKLRAEKWRNVQSVVLKLPDSASLPVFAGELDQPKRKACYGRGAEEEEGSRRRGRSSRRRRAASPSRRS